jgi:lipopolysaccharide biosynthesis glycosyltransferase
VKGWRKRRIPANAAYFNAGVLVVDLEAWRRRNVVGRAMDYIRSADEPVDFLHQEALNAAAWDDWLPLAPRWNVPSTAGRWFDQTDAAAVAAPAIVHFAGRMKPWRMSTGSRFEAAYADVLMRVGGRMPIPAATRRDRILGWYDRTLRSVCHPAERVLWARRLL